MAGISEKDLLPELLGNSGIVVQSTRVRKMSGVDRSLEYGLAGEVAPSADGSNWMIC